jgi:methionine synthase II (cobalamin-independent)
MNQTAFLPFCRPLLIGSIPLEDHREATELILDATPDIPLWAQLPVYSHEGMMAQFLPGLPGHTRSEEREYVDTSSESFESELVSFYEEYMAVTEGAQPLDQTRFVLDDARAKGFSTLIRMLRDSSPELFAVKGQITGPITFATGVKDQDKRAVFYDDQLRDAAVKLLALKAGWQVEHLSQFNVPVILFLDEPALAGFGSSEFISISKQDVLDSLNEIIDQIHQRNGLAGVHVCANADWSVILDSKADILSFDAYTYFDKLAIFSQDLTRFLDRGGIIAWGIVPTLEPETIDRETAQSLLSQLQSKIDHLVELGIDRSKLLAQSLITPSCGTGSLSADHARKVLTLTKEVSLALRQGLQA